MPRHEAGKFNGGKGESRQSVTVGRSMGREGFETDDERSRGRGRRGEEEAGESRPGKQPDDVRS